MPPPTPVLARLRTLCLALPEAEERETWNCQTFRLRGRIFAMHVPGTAPVEAALWCKAPRGVQQLLVEADPARFFRPPYLGHRGWIGLRLAAPPDWPEVEALIRRSWSMTAPRRLAATLPPPASNA